jgi:tetratricopeptide (TPR) repeat protein
LNLGKYNEAIDCFDKAVKLYPNFGYAWISLTGSLWLVCIVQVLCVH